MLRIQCPYCGTRDQDEFRCGGEAAIVRPTDPESSDDGDWARYLFYRTNAKGVQTERWLHAYGCRQWFLLVRDTATHVIEGAYRLDEPPPDTPAPSEGLAS